MSASTWMQAHGGRTDAYTNNDLPSLSKMAAGVSVVSTEGAGGGESAAEDGEKRRGLTRRVRRRRGGGGGGGRRGSWLGGEPQASGTFFYLKGADESTWTGSGQASLIQDFDAKLLPPKEPRDPSHGCPSLPQARKKGERAHPRSSSPSLTLPRSSPSAATTSTTSRSSTTRFRKSPSSSSSPHRPTCRPRHQEQRYRSPAASWPTMKVHFPRILSSSRFTKPHSRTWPRDRNHRS